jgi:ParB family transcriptional regulator, chromosome partitioning protein
VAERTRGMGRGLSAILASSAPPVDGEASDPELRAIPVDLIAPNPRQPRQDFDDASLVALADSLRERGVLQPVLLRPVPGGTYELIAGERRWRAARLAGFDQVPALVRPQGDAESLELALIENMAREDLNPVEEARACTLLVEELGLTREDVGRRVGRSRVAVSNLMRLLELPDEVLDLLTDGTLSEGHGRALLMASDHSDRRRLARTAAQEGWTVRRTEEQARATEGDAGDAGAAGTLAGARRRAPELHPDQAEAAGRLGDALGRVLGTDVRVAPKGEGYKVTLAFASLDEAMALAERLGAVEAA